jgi:hypothetical protein
MSQRRGNTQLAISFAEGSPAKTSPRQEKAVDSEAPAAACGGTSSASRGKSGRNSSSWLPTIRSSLENCRKRYWRAAPWAVNTRKDGRAPSPSLKAAILCLLPTLTTARNLLSPAMKKWPAHERMLPAWGPVRLSLRGLTGGGSLSPTWCEWFMGFPEDWTALDAEAWGIASSRSARGSCSAPSSPADDPEAAAVQAASS